jgi:hypothetical protein
MIKLDSIVSMAPTEFLHHHTTKKWGLRSRCACTEPVEMRLCEREGMRHVQGTNCVAGIDAGLTTSKVLMRSSVGPIC